MEKPSNRKVYWENNKKDSGGTSADLKPVLHMVFNFPSCQFNEKVDCKLKSLQWFITVI